MGRAAGKLIMSLESCGWNNVFRYLECSESKKHWCSCMYLAGLLYAPHILTISRLNLPCRAYVKWFRGNLCLAGDKHTWSNLNTRWHNEDSQSRLSNLLSCPVQNHFPSLWLLVDPIYFLSENIWFWDADSKLRFSTGKGWMVPGPHVQLPYWISTASNNLSPKPFLICKLVLSYTLTVAIGTIMSGSPISAASSVDQSWFWRTISTWSLVTRILKWLVCFTSLFMQVVLPFPP